MNCAELQESLLAEPARRSEAIDAHLAACGGCREFVRELEAMEGVLRRALSVPVHDARRASPVVAISRPARWRPQRFALALAAGLAVVAVSIGVLLIAYPRETLATGLVGHMGHEPDSWRVTDQVVTPASLGYVLGRSGVRLAENHPGITYAHSCWFRGWFVPHLVVQTPAGPMTVMVLRHEHVQGPEHINEGGYRGVILPAGKGSVAVLAHEAASEEALESVAAQVRATVGFIG